MKNYSDVEKADADKLKEIEGDLFHDKSKWDKILEDLNLIYDNIPPNYVNSFKEDGKLYYKFWGFPEFNSFIKTEETERDVVWLENAYSKCCYFLSIIHIERGNFEVAFQILKRGLELEPDSPVLLSEMGLLFTSIGTSSGDKDYFKESVVYFDKAFKSRPFNSSTQKARALRGIGYALIELQEYERAKSVYEASLTWEHSEIAVEELKVIDDFLSNPNIKITSQGSNFNEDAKFHTLEYFEATLKKLPQKLQDNLPNQYVYIWTKATRLLGLEPEIYRQEDFFKFPLKEWNDKIIMSGVNQIVHYLKGIDETHPLEMSDQIDATNLIRTFHFEPLQTINIDSTILKIHFKHSVSNDKTTLFFKVPTSIEQNTSSKKKKWKFW